MKLRLALLGLPFALFQSAVSEADTRPRIALTVNAPLVSVSPRPAGRHFVNLPELEFSFDIDAQCSTGWVAESLFLNVADTRLTFNAEQLAGNRHGPAVMRVSARQLAPIAVHDFCATENADTNADSVPALGSDPTAEPHRRNLKELTVSAALSAHASLRCASDSQQRVAYVSQPLDLTLACAAAEYPAVAD
ncbi:MAG: hypothetical protein WDZ50_06665 [Woeseia sp.]